MFLPQSQAVRWLRRFAWRRPIWFSIVLGVALVTGSMACRGYDRTRGDWECLEWHLKALCTVVPPLEQSLDRIHLARDGYFQPVVYYPARFIDVVNLAHRKREDILTSFEVLDRAWRAGGDEPLSIRFTCPPSADPYTGGRSAAVIYPSDSIQKANFMMLLPLLQEIRTLIIEGEGDGRGLLNQSGYQVEPVQTQAPSCSEPAGEKQAAPLSRSKKSG